MFYVSFANLTRLYAFKYFFKDNLDSLAVFIIKYFNILRECDFLCLKEIDEIDVLEELE